MSVLEYDPEEEVSERLERLFCEDPPAASPTFHLKAAEEQLLLAAQGLYDVDQERVLDIADTASMIRRELDGGDDAEV